MSTSETLRQVALVVGEELADRDTVETVLLVGSTAVGYADEFSDVDLQVVGEIESGERSVEGVHVEWTPVSREDIEADLTGWDDDAALYTYATAELLYDEAGIAEVISDYEDYPPAIRREKLFAGWFYGTGNTFDAQKADERGDTRAKRCAAVSAVEQFTALTYLLDDQIPPYRKWLFRDVPDELPGIDGALSGDVGSLELLTESLEPKLRSALDDERIDKPYLFQPEFGPLG